MNREKAPLFRKQKKTGLTFMGHLQTGPEFKWRRNTKKFKNLDLTHEGMNPKRFGYDYTPLFRFLLSKVGHLWDETYKEAQIRLKGQSWGEKPIWWMVAKTELDRNQYGYVNIGENSMWSQLFINENGLLEISKPGTTGKVSCSCCTHTFNGEVVASDVPENWFNPKDFNGYHPV